MSLYDVMDDITRRQMSKTDTGDSRIFGVVLGIVAKNYDKDMPGRVCVNIPTRDKDANELKWARLAMPSGGEKWGHYFLPEVGDQVLLVFEDGNIERPYIIGCVPKDDSAFRKENVDEKNQKKAIKTKHGSLIEFTDAAEGDGKKDKITIETPEKMHTVIMDNENDNIQILDKEKKNAVVIDTKKGEMDVTVDKKLTIKVGSSVTITMDGTAGNVEVKCKNLKVTTDMNTEIKSNAKLQAQGNMVEISAQGTLNVKSSGQTAVKGSVVQIG